MPDASEDVLDGIDMMDASDVLDDVEVRVCGCHERDGCW